MIKKQLIIYYMVRKGFPAPFLRHPHLKPACPLFFNCFHSPSFLSHLYKKKTTRKKNLIPSYEINAVQLSTVINNGKQMQIFHVDNFKLKKLVITHDHYSCCLYIYEIWCVIEIIS